MSRPLHAIAAEVRKDWKNVNYAAKPYLDAMATLQQKAAAGLRSATASQKSGRDTQPVRPMLSLLVNKRLGR